MHRRLRVRLLHWIEALELDARIRGAEVPVYGANSLIAMILWFSLTLITHQQDTGHHIVLGRGATRAIHRFQPAMLLLAQSHGIAVVIGAHAYSSFLSSCRSQPLPAGRDLSPIPL